MWYADDASAAGSLNRIVSIEPEYGYFPKASKTWLIVKDNDYEKATSLFQGTGVSITTEGRWGSDWKSFFYSDLYSGKVVKVGK